MESFKELVFPEGFSGLSPKPSGNNLVLLLMYYFIFCMICIILSIFCYIYYKVLRVQLDINSEHISDINKHLFTCLFNCYSLSFLAHLWNSEFNWTNFCLSLLFVAFYLSSAAFNISLFYLFLILEYCLLSIFQDIMFSFQTLQELYEM